jgi:hypothetical protein
MEGGDNDGDEDEEDALLSTLSRASALTALVCRRPFT